MYRILGLFLMLACKPKATDASGDTDVGDTDVVGHTDTHTDVTHTDDTFVPATLCGAIVGQTFASLEPGECGLGPDGVVLCTWHVSFTATTWSWQHSDVGMSGTYTCQDGVIDADPGSGTHLAGTVDAGTKQLTWDGVVYAPEVGAP